jgi:hypothetical protein
MLRADEDPELLVFDPVIRFFHWLTLFLVATIFVLAFSIDFASSKEEAVALIQLHRSFGVTVWVVMLARLVWRQFSRFPNWPADMPQATRFVAQWSEYALYALMLTQPIVGPIRPIRLDLGLDIGAIFSGRGLDDCSLERSEYKRSSMPKGPRRWQTAYGAPLGAHRVSRKAVLPRSPAVGARPNAVRSPVGPSRRPNRR